MAIVPTQSDILAEDSAVTLPRYAAMISYDECAFFGVSGGIPGRLTKSGGGYGDEIRQHREPVQ